MSKLLTAFIAAVFLAGYAVQPPEKTVPYKVTLRNGETAKVSGMPARKSQAVKTACGKWSTTH